MPLTDAEKFAALTPDEQAAALATLYVDANMPAEPDSVLAPEETVDDFADLDSFYDDTLALTFRGVEYVVQAPDVELGLLCHRVWASGIGSRTGHKAAKRRQEAQETADAVLDDDTEEALYVRLLGGDTTHPYYDAALDVFAKLKANRAPWPLVKHMGTTAFLWTVESREAALSFWHAGGRDPKAQQPAPATPPPARRAPTDHKAPAGRASTTRKRASGSSTTTRAKAGTRGATSGDTGA